MFSSFFKALANVLRGNSRKSSKNSSSSAKAKKAARRKTRLTPELRVEAFEDRIVPAGTPVQTYFVPLPETAIRNAFVTLYSGTSQQLNSVISLAATGSNTVIYYDQWE